MNQPTTPRTDTLTDFRALFDLIAPDKPNPERVKLCAAYSLLSESSVRVYLSPQAPHGPSERTISILTSALRKRRLI